MPLSTSQLIAKQATLMQRMPMPKDMLKHLNDWYKIELSYTSCAIEGNALSRADCALAIDKQLASGGKKISDHLQVIANAKAWEMVRDLGAKKSDHEIDASVIATVYRLLSSQPLDKDKLNNVLASKTSNYLEAIINCHFQYLSQKPFPEQNGQMARLLLNLSLMQAGFTPAVIETRVKPRYLKSIANYTTSPTELQQIIYYAIAKSLDIFIKTAENGASSLSHSNKQPAKIVAKQGLLKIGELAAVVGETVPTIRFWTKEGLLTVQELSKGGYQLYDHSQITKAQQIRALQNEQKLSIKELKAKLAGSL